MQFAGHISDVFTQACFDRHVDVFEAGVGNPSVAEVLGDFFESSISVAISLVSQSQNMVFLLHVTTGSNKLKWLCT